MSERTTISPFEAKPSAAFWRERRPNRAVARGRRNTIAFAANAARAPSGKLQDHRVQGQPVAIARDDCFSLAACSPLVVFRPRPGTAAGRL